MARDRKDPLVSLDRSPLHLLHRAEQCASDTFLSVVEPNELTPRQFAVLVTIAKFEGLSQTHLVERTGIDRSTIADITRRLLKKGLVHRRRAHKDARAYAVKLTEVGWRTLRSVEPIMKRIDETILSALPFAHRERFVDDLGAVIAALRLRQTT